MPKSLGNFYSQDIPTVRPGTSLYDVLQFLDAQASLAPTQVSLSVRWSVGDTFEFPFYQRLWLLYVKS